MYERRGTKPLDRLPFAARMLKHFAIVTALAAASLAGGMAGYEYFEHLAWPDAFLNAAMLLGGMGPVDAPRSEAGKLFAGLYALYAGTLFLVVGAILLAPVVHRVLHRFHWDPR